MKKIIAIMLASLFIFAGCGSETTVSFNAEGFMNEVKALSLDDELVEIPETVATTFYDFSGIAHTYLLYASGTRATSSEVMVVTAENASDVEALKTVLEERKQVLIDEYKDYIPAEAERAENAIIEVKGNSVILAITGYNDEVSAIIESNTTEE